MNVVDISARVGRVMAISAESADGHRRNTLTVSSGAFHHSAANPLDRNILDLWVHSMVVRSFARRSITDYTNPSQSEMSKRLKFI